MKWRNHSYLVILITITLIMSCNGNPYSQGEKLYVSYCVNCHMEDGTGLQKIIPPLDNADYLHKYPKRVACMIKYGAVDTIIVNDTSYFGVMPGQPDLTDVQITNIINYINNAWSNRLGFTPADSVKKWLEDCPTDY